MTATDIIQVSFEAEQSAYPEYVIKDAKRSDEWPENELHTVALHPDEITIEGTPEALRWLYDWMEWAEDEFKLEDGQMEAKGCRQVADEVWGALGEDPPERQRTRRVSDGGEVYEGKPGTSHCIRCGNPATVDDRQYCDDCLNELERDGVIPDGGRRQCQVPGCDSVAVDESDICADCHGDLQRQLELSDADRHLRGGENT